MREKIIRSPAALANTSYIVCRHRLPFLKLYVSFFLLPLCLCLSLSLSLAVSLYLSLSLSLSLFPISLSLSLSLYISLPHSPPHTPSPTLFHIPSIPKSNLLRKHCSAEVETFYLENVVFLSRVYTNARGTINFTENLSDRSEMPTISLCRTVQNYFLYNFNFLYNF